jgi:hypothetical protein
MVEHFSRQDLLADAASILAHPGYAEARRRYTDTGLTVVDGHPLVAKVICQTSRYATMLLILSFHDMAEDGASGGATAGQVLAAIGRTPFASISWAKLMVRVFHRAGLVEYTPPGADRRVRPFTPTPKLLELGHQSIAIFLEALGHVRPLPRPAAELARQPGVLTGFARVVVDCYFVHRFSMLEPFPPTEELFKRDFGYLIFTHLIQTMQPGADGQIYASAPASEMQRRYGVSRASVRNFLDHAQSIGLLEPQSKAGHILRCTPQFVDLTDHWVATDLAWLNFVLNTTLNRLSAREAPLAA